ncbi:MAG: helix-turn-helix transcriptional regulator [Dehalococcoidia bacterium]|jgi:transcriptional regulator with XRE-family HTH domain
MRIGIEFGTRLRQIRQAKKIPQERLAELAGLDRTYISKIEKGQRNISLEIVAKLASALDIRVRDFFTDYDENS